MDGASETADQIKTGYLEYTQRQNVEPGEARRELEAVAENEQVPSDAKALEGESGG